MSNILQELEAEIKKATASVSQENVGVIRSVGDGVAKIEGLSGVMLNEMIEFPGGVMGLAMNLEEHEVGAVVLGDDSKWKGTRSSVPDAFFPCPWAAPCWAGW